MKKNLIIALVLTNLFTLGSNMYYCRETSLNEKAKNELIDSYSKMTERYYDIKDDHDELVELENDKSNQIYNIVEGKNYNVTITKDGRKINYEKTGKGFFRNKNKTTNNYIVR